MVPESRLGNIKENNLKTFRCIGDVNLPGLVIRYSRDKKDKNLLQQIK